MRKVNSVAKKEPLKKDSPKKEASKKEAHVPSVNRDEQIGFHKGSLMTLSKERTELMRILGIVEQLIQMHTAALKELGVQLDSEPATQQAPPKKKPPIEDIL